MPLIENPAPGTTGDGAGLRYAEQLPFTPASPQNQAAPAFDYAALTGNVAGDLRQRATRIRHCIRASVIDVGRELREAKRHELDHGQFIAWIEAECGLNKRTAQRMMQAAEWAEDKNDTVSLLPP